MLAGVASVRGQDEPAGPSPKKRAPDAVNAYLWLRDTGAGKSRIVVAGDSSAGGLAMSLLLALRERDWLCVSASSRRPPGPC